MGAKDDKRAKAERARKLLGLGSDDSPESGPSGVVLPSAPERAAEPKTNRPTISNAARKVGKFEAFVRPVRFEPDPIRPEHVPKKHEPGSLKRGDTVWYHDSRYWVESAPKDWTRTCTVRISSERVHPDPDRLPPKERESFCVHADTLDLAPAPKNVYGHHTTFAEEQRKERARSGQRDIGDEVAGLLRGKSLDECYTAAARFLRVPEDGLRIKYQHLNPGQQRMCLGNGMRFHLKKENKHA